MSCLIEGPHRIGKALSKLVHDYHLLGGHVDVKMDGPILGARLAKVNSTLVLAGILRCCCCPFLEFENEIMMMSSRCVV